MSKKPDPTNPDVSPDRLVSGIAEDAEAEAKRLFDEARTMSERRRRSAENQATDTLGSAEKKASEQAEAILTQCRSAGAMEARRHSLRIREEVLERVIAGTRKRLAAMIDEPGYREVLLGWIVEAGIGLNEPKAAVNASLRERVLLDDALLQEAAGKIRELIGYDVMLEPDTGPPLVGQGIKLNAAGGRVAFSNDVTTRLLRYQSEIRKLVYEELFET